MTYAIPEGTSTFIYRRDETGTPQFLLMLRHPDDGGFWQGPGGGVEHGETLQQTAVREIAEECGLEISPPVRLDAQLQFPLQPDEIGTRYAPHHTHFTIHFFVAALQGRRDCPVYEEGAHVDHHWVSLEDGLQLLNPEAHRQALRTAASWLTNSENI